MIQSISIGSTPNDHTGVALRNAVIQINQVIAELNRIGLDQIDATSEEIDILHNLDPNTVYIGDVAVLREEIDAALTDNTPTAAEITAAIGKTPSQAGKGYKVSLKDTSGSGLIYFVESDGTDWFYVKFTKAI